MLYDPVKDRTRESIYDAVEDSIRDGISLADFNRVVAQAWIEIHRQIAANASKDVEAWISKMQRPI